MCIYIYIYIHIYNTYIRVTLTPDRVNSVSPPSSGT